MPLLDSGFMSADLPAIERAVEALPWVDHARVQRRWPNSLHVTVVEQTAAARWGEAGLLNTRGEVFVGPPPTCRPSCRDCPGPTARSRRSGAATCRRRSRMVEAGMRIAALRLDERGAWEMDLDSGITVRLGRREVDERLDRFIRTAAQVIAHRVNEVAYVDMRYSNGFAIGWRTQAAAAQRPRHAASPAGSGDRRRHAR